MENLNASLLVRLDAVSLERSGFCLNTGKELCIESGETVALIGPSGAGKTSLLRLLAGLEKPTTGQLTWRCGMRPSIAYVSQELDLWPHMTVEENVGLPLVYRKFSKTIIQERTHSILKRLGIEKSAKATPSALSGGQRQRAAIARALITEAPLLLLDEITASVDPETTAGILAILAGLKGSCTTIFATHHIRFAHLYSDRIIFIVDGAISEIVRGSDLFSSGRGARLSKFLAEVSTYGV